MKRTGIAFSDGAFIVHPEGWPLDKVIAECEQANSGESNVDHLAKIVEVEIRVVDEKVVPMKQTMVRCQCGRQYRTLGGIQECLATNHPAVTPTNKSET